MVHLTTQGELLTLRSVAEPDPQENGLAGVAGRAFSFIVGQVFVCALFSAAAQFLAQRYWELGYWRNGADIVERWMLGVLLVGLGAGALVGGLSLLWQKLRRGRLASVEFRPGHLFPSIAVGSLIGGMVAALAREPHVRRFLPLVRRWWRPMGFGFVIVVASLHYIEPRISENSAIAQLSSAEAWIVHCGMFVASVAISWLSGFPRAGPKRATRPLLVATCVTVTAAVAFCGAFWTPPSLAADRPHNILLIGIDTLRADHTNLTNDTDRADDNGRRSLTPRLREFAKRGLTYESAYAQAPWTLPSNLSIMTGLYPHQHQAEAFGDVARLGLVTLPELLREAGYDTAGVVSHIFVAARRGFAQGILHFDDALSYGDMHATQSAEEVSDRSIAWLQDRDRNEPFFLWSYYFDPHYEFLDREEWTWANNYDGWLAEWYGELSINGLRTFRHHLGEAEVEYLLDLYDEEIAATDREIGRLLDRLEELGELENTIVVVYADHGEEFMERGWLGHTTSVHSEVTKVPLIYVSPASPPGSVVRSVVEVRSLMWSIVDEVGLPEPQNEGSSNPLPRVDDPDALAFTEVHMNDVASAKVARQRAVRSNARTVIIDDVLNQTLRYDRTADPAEHNPLPPNPNDPLHSVLEAWRRGEPARSGPVPASEIEQLRSLGYIH